MHCFNDLYVAAPKIKSFAGRRSAGRDSMNRGSRLSGINMSGASIALSLDNDSLSELATSTAFFPDLDFTQSGYLYKKSNKKLHKQWQKRRCRIEDGHFWLSHSDVIILPARINFFHFASLAIIIKAFESFNRSRYTTPGAVHFAGIDTANEIELVGFGLQTVGR